MEITENNEAKERILNASIRLFSEKGFDTTRVNEIAEAASVTKALIYYYFKSKEEILDNLVHTLLDSATSITMDFVHSSIIQMIKDKRLDIEPDKLHFVSEDAVQYYITSVNEYYERLLDFALENRAILRILLLESLKTGKHHNALFQIIDFGFNNSDSTIYKTIVEADHDFNYTDDFRIFKSFHAVLPLINFAAYYDEYQMLSALSESEMRASFIRSSQVIFTSLVKGSDILFRNKR